MIHITHRWRAEEAIKQSEERYRTMFADSPEPMWIFDLETLAFLEVNQAAVVHYGYSVEEFLSMTIKDIRPMEDIAILLKSVEPTNRTYNQLGEFRHIKKNGEIIDVRITWHSVIFRGRKARHVLVGDITTRKLAEEALKESEEKYRLIVENIGEGFGFVNAKEQFLLANKAAEMIFGVGPGCLVNMNLNQFVSKEQSEIVQKETSIRTNGIQSVYELDIIRPNGQIRTIGVTAVPQKDKEGNFLGTYGIFLDITERKLAETALLESEKLFRSVLESVSLVGVMLDRNGRITLCNDFLLGLTGWTREEVMHQNWFDRFVPEKIRTTLELFQSSIQKDEITEHYENEIITRTGDLRLIAWNNIILHDHLGAVSGIASIGEDITERKRMEAEVKYKNEELQKLNASKDKFFSIIAHDLKSPFNSILGFSQILEEQMKEKDYTAIEKYSKIINDSSLRAMNLLANLMEWSRSQTGRMEFKLEFCDMAVLIQEVILLLNASALQKSITIDQNLPLTIRLFADKAMMSTVIRNLVSNAIKFTIPGGRITISMEQTQMEHIFIVQDTGVGISKSGMEKLFRIEESFSTPGTQKEKGTGLGLILCKDFVEMHGGKIWVESEPGIGSVFKFSVPV